MYVSLRMLCRGYISSNFIANASEFQENQWRNVSSLFTVDQEQMYEILITPPVSKGLNYSLS